MRLTQSICHVTFVWFFVNNGLVKAVFRNFQKEHDMENSEESTLVILFTKNNKSIGKTGNDTL